MLELTLAFDELAAAQWVNSDSTRRMVAPLVTPRGRANTEWLHCLNKRVESGKRFLVFRTLANALCTIYALPNSWGYFFILFLFFA